MCNSIFYQAIQELVVMGKSLIAHIKTGDNLDDFQTKTTSGARLGIPIFGSDFWDPHRKQNSDSVSDSGYSGQIFVFRCWKLIKLEFRFAKFGIP